MNRTPANLIPRAPSDTANSFIDIINDDVRAPRADLSMTSTGALPRQKLWSG